MLPFLLTWRSKFSDDKQITSNGAINQQGKELLVNEGPKYPTEYKIDAFLPTVRFSLFLLNAYGHER